MREAVLSGVRLAAVATAGLLATGAGVGTSVGVELPAAGGPSTCPLPDAVWSELVTLVPRERLNARLRAVAGNGGPVVQIIDLGVPYRVIVGGQVREYRDETRDCAYRARIAAVFVALAIDPAEISMPETPPPQKSPEPPTPPPSTRDARRAAAHLDLGVAGDLGVGSANRAAEGGAALRLVVGRHHLALATGAMALLPIDTNLRGVRLRQWRLPVDVGVRAQLAGKRFESYGELGLGAALLSERALDLASPQSGTSVELGVRVGVGARLVTQTRFAPFAALHAEVVPSPIGVFALPQGIVGHTPWLWIGATAGASMELP